jgi:hypothetical protein
MADQDAPRLGASVSVKLQIMSDLHLETPRFLPMYSDFHFDPKSTYLCLLGDIGSIHDNRLFHFLELQLQRFDIVFYVIGNHESYQDEDSGSFKQQNNTYPAALSKMERFEASVIAQRNTALKSSDNTPFGQFVLLNRRRFDLTENVTVLGCTLFSNIADSQKSAVSLFVSDFSKISEWTTDSHNSAHRVDLEWLNNEVDAISRNEPHRSIAVFTHYSPTSSPEANDPEEFEDPHGVQSAFVTNLEREVCWTSPSVKLWAFGHTHFNCDFVDPKVGTRVVANQRGYGREEAFDFEAEKVVVV